MQYSSLMKISHYYLLRFDGYLGQCHGKSKTEDSSRIDFVQSKEASCFNPLTIP